MKRPTKLSETLLPALLLVVAGSRLHQRLAPSGHGHRRSRGAEDLSRGIGDTARRPFRAASYGRCPPARRGCGHHVAGHRAAVSPPGAFLGPVCARIAPTGFHDRHHGAPDGLLLPPGGTEALAEFPDCGRLHRCDLPSLCYASGDTAYRIPRVVYRVPSSPRRFAAAGGVLQRIWIRRDHRWQKSWRVKQWKPSLC